MTGANFPIERVRGHYGGPAATVQTRNTIYVRPLALPHEILIRLTVSDRR